MRLIDADALKMEILRRLTIVSPDVAKYANGVLNFIANAPTIEAEPMRYGRWVHTDLAAHWYGKDECSECTYHEHDRSDLSHFNYCPHCGAKMIKENEDAKVD